MSKFSTLVNILDRIIDEAPSNLSKKYNVKDVESQNQARSRAFIHLYLKVSFGILSFDEREHFITDGSHDGGIDGYFINSENATIYLIQSKFRINSDNFEKKEISIKEILKMDVDRILDGESEDEDENKYNGKIKQLQRELSHIDNIARYSYRIIILANLSDIKLSDLRKLCGGLSCEVFNFENCYEKLVFPVITGTFFNASELTINIDLSNKNAGSKISYAVQTKKGLCEITVLFVPTIELARIMSKYKNSILKFNPRSYLGHDEGKNVNTAIKSTILESETNEFALFNNGITMLSDETLISEKIGQKYKAKLFVKNPQIINGGQTSYTLSQIYSETPIEEVEKLFQDKEVLVKIITLQENKDIDSKLDLINAISEATNKQTPVVNADRYSNEKLQIELQKKMFSRYNILYERKRGEFADGIYNNYISKTSIVERNLFYRMYFASNGYINQASEKKVFFKQGLEIEDITDDQLDNMYFGYLCMKKMNLAKSSNQRIDLSEYAKIYVLVLLFKPSLLEDFENNIDSSIDIVNTNWNAFLEFYKSNFLNTKTVINKKTGEKKTFQSFNLKSWYNSRSFKDDVINFYKNELQKKISTTVS